MKHASAVLDRLASRRSVAIRLPTARPGSFGRYRVLRSLGAGGFARVYLAHDAQLERDVAVKAFRVPVSDMHRAGPFLQEARRLAKLRHAGIAAVHDAGIERGWLYVVSDYIDGPDLATQVRSQRLSWRAAARIAMETAEALGHAHAHRTIHRDIKPANIMLTQAGQAVIVDFGLGVDETTDRGCLVGAVTGTPAYMSPEQVNGEAHRIDGRTDIYSLGVVLYEMLCGRPPFSSVKLPELLRQVTDDDPQPPRQLAPDLPRGLERVCLRALAKRPADRHATGADFARALRKFAG